MLGWIAYFTVAILWGSTYFGIAVGLGSFTPYGMVAVRFSIGALLALIIGRLRREPLPSKSDFGHLIFVGILLLACSNAFVVWAEQYVSSAITAVLMAMTPFWLAFFYMRKERLSWLGWAGLLLGIGGVAVLVWPDGEQEFHALSFAALIAAPMIWAFGTLHGRDHIRSSGLFTNVGIEMAAAAIIGLVVASNTGGFLHAPLTQASLAAVLYLAVFGSLLGFSAYIYLLNTWPPAKAGTFAYLNPLVAVLLGALVLHEAFGVRQLLGMVIILMSVAVVQMKAKTIAS